MTVQTLAELKALNEAAEQAEAAATVKAEADEEAEVLEGELEEQEEVSADPVEEGDETEGEEGEQEETPEWLKPAEGAVPVAKHVEMKHKLKAKLQSSDDEIARLKAENEALRSGSHAPQVQRAADAPVMPKMDDPDIAFDDAKFSQRMAEYASNLVDYKLASAERNRAQTSQQEQQNAFVQSGLDKHYERAGALVSKGIISAENYQAADHIVRKAMVESIPNGEMFLDYLIAQLGEGSEAVIAHIGVNPQALSTLKEKIKNDPTGIAATAYLGGLNERFKSASTIDKSSKAPRPDRPLNGTAKVGSGGLHAAYKKSFAAQDGKSLSIKREAKAKGIDTSKW